MGRVAKEIKFGLAALDVVVLVACWSVAFYLRFHTGFPVSKGIPSFLGYLKLSPILIAIWLTIGLQTGIYRSIKARASRLLKNIFFTVVTLIVITYLIDDYRYSRMTIVLFLCLLFGAVPLRQYLARIIVGAYARFVPPSNAVLVTSPETFARGLDVLERHDLGSRNLVVVCFGDRDLIARPDLKVISPPESWIDFLSESRCDHVFVALPYSQSQFFDDHVDEIANQVTNLQLLPDLARFNRLPATAEVVGSHIVITINESPLGMGANSLIKRGLDIVGSVVAIVIFSPVMLLCAALVKLSSSGPIFYYQERMGLDGSIFWIRKFRSMKVNSERETGAVWATSEDPRTTMPGKWLRRYSLDELPQLFNVLRGDMSLVGPRPERPVFVEKFRRDVPGYMLRHKVKAGMTGWAQVNGWRGNTSISRRIEYDLFYIQNWSLILDIKILFSTIFRGFNDPNAY